MRLSGQQGIAGATDLSISQSRILDASGSSTPGYTLYYFIRLQSALL
jgi:hypothetical protein